jgi:hydroxypyruvate isomerase
MIENTQDALAVLNVINHNYLLLQYDLYHGAMNAEDLIKHYS